jgi:two-component system sensor histidine kinase DevS
LILAHVAWGVKRPETQISPDREYRVKLQILMGKPDPTQSGQIDDRLASLHRASLELVREIELEPLLHRIANLVREQVKAHFAAVGLLSEAGELEEYVPVGLTPLEVNALPTPPIGRALIGALTRSDRPIRLPHLVGDERSEGFPTPHLETISFLGAPIRQGDKTLGLIYATDKVDAPEFTLDDELLIETLATYSAAAISNARLYQKLMERERSITRRSENLALLNDLADTLATSADIDQVLDKAFKQVMDFFHLEVCEIYLMEEEGKMLKLVLHLGEMVKTLWKSSRFQVGEGMVGAIAATGQAQSIALPGDASGELSMEALEEGFQQVVCFPLAGRRGVLGVVCVATSQPQTLDDLGVQFLTAIGSWVGTAVENLRLNIQQRRLAVLEERERIGMDLHDGIIQSIYAVGLTLENARISMPKSPEKSLERISQAISNLNSTIRDIRAYILDLRPRQLYEEDLMDGIKRLAEEFRANTLIEIKVDGPAAEQIHLPEEPAKALFHICQESLANVAKHSQARHVDVSLWTTGERAVLEVRDDGKGFDAAKVKLSLGHGVSNMYTRAHNVSGEVELTSEPGEGTTVLAWVPCHGG